MHQPFRPKQFFSYSLFFLMSWLWCIPCTTYADYFDSRASYQVYFTPTHNCTAHIIRAIQRAKHNLYVQAYFLTSKPIIAELVAAKRRHISVEVILDKNHPENQSATQQMLAVGIPVWIDKTSGIAHNKIMIIDNEQVITGSFNFTHAANHKNRENLLLIHDQHFARYYLENWYRCQMRSTQITPLRNHTQEQENTGILAVFSKFLDALVCFLDTIARETPLS